MSFEEIQSIWNSQQTLDESVDKEALQSWLKAKNRSFTWIVDLTEIVMTLTLLFVAAMFMRDPLLQGHDRVLIVGGIACIIAAIFVWTGRIARKKREVHYEDSLRGIIERSIDAIDYQAKRMRNFVWCFACPVGLGLLIGLFIVDDSKRYLFYWIFIPAFVVCMALTYWTIRREIRTNLIPEKSRLEELRDAFIKS